MIKCILFFLMGNVALAQTVSTFLVDDNVDVDDALIFDNDGNLYGSNFGGDTVYKITPEGVATPFASGFNNPNGLAFDTDGNLFVVDWGAGSIHKYDPSGNLLNTYNVGPTPSGLIASPSGTMIFTDTADDSIIELGTDGSMTTLFEGAPLNAPVGLTYDENNTLYIGNYVGREVYRLVGNNVEYIATVPDGNAADNPFLGFITYAEGFLYGTTMGGHKIYKIDPTQTDVVTSFAGGIQGDVDGDIALATFSYPNGIVYKPTEQALYISEFSGVGNIRKIEDFVLGTEEHTAIRFSIAPNPVGDNLHMYFENRDYLDHSEVLIYNALGVLVSTHKGNNEGIINVSQLPEGMYFMEFIAEGTIRTIKTFVKN